ncbi:MAG: TetR/AcrR family transcriptional regulator [Spirochaetaceae bacterium]|nr:TetR/AcrR family transcriptional regulator [Myxococcales bacterium]MCB9726680.1 TetR/AcrR family transcriptional regulator [Spirochaetaceae bacterium]
MSRRPRAATAKERARTLRDEAYREAIAEAAEVLFGEHGIDGTKMEDIARDAGFAVTTVYSAFRGGKAEIVEAVHERRLSDMVRAAESYVQSEGPALDRLAASNRQSVHFFMDHENYLRMHLREGHAWFLADAVAGRVRGGAIQWAPGVGAVVEMVEQGIANGEFDLDDARRAGKSIVMLQQLHLSEWIERGSSDVRMRSSNASGRMPDSCSARPGRATDRPSRLRSCASPDGAAIRPPAS